MNIIALESPEAQRILIELEQRRRDAAQHALDVAQEAIAGVRALGDDYVAQQIEKYDKVRIDPSDICLVPRSAIVEPELVEAIEMAIEHGVRALRRVGIYVPGGRAVYISTLIMCAVPALIAGVEEIVVATPPAAAARPELQYVCTRLGVRNIYRAGGAAGVAALAIGTQTLARVDKIVGPGNAYVTAAKARLVGEVGIDMTAGPTELIVIADESADAAL